MCSAAHHAVRFADRHLGSERVNMMSDSDPQTSLTLTPYLASSAAHERPPIPEPMTTTSVVCDRSCPISCLFACRAIDLRCEHRPTMAGFDFNMNCVWSTHARVVCGVDEMMRRALVRPVSLWWKWSSQLLLLQNSQQGTLFSPSLPLRLRGQHACAAAAAPKAALMIIGDEILAGNVQDTNTSFLAKLLHR